MAALGLTVLISMGAHVAVSGQKGSRLRDVPVTATVADGLAIASDGLGDYADADGVKSIITNTGVWTLDTHQFVTTRGIRLSFADPVAGTGPGGADPVPPASDLYHAWLYSSCNHFGVNPQTMSSGEVVTCPMAVVFEAGGNEYILHMNGNNHPETDPVNFVCTAGTPCTSWRIEPSGSGLTNVARLSIRTTEKGKTIVVPLGNFRISFAIALER
jgi:hypothetical protein